MGSLSSSMERWLALQQALAGMFCASLQHIGEAHTALPHTTLRRPGDRDRHHTLLMYGALPSEAVCTENTTPFLKLLPCQRRVGRRSTCCTCRW